MTTQTTNLLREKAEELSNAILIAAGSSLRNYTMHREDIIREAERFIGKAVQDNLELTLRVGTLEDEVKSLRDSTGGV